ncbi:MAG TPA: hypothetical protein VJN94_16995 [Candidatus Binataceae bacterium]|nr:hypothetical protein [Candidatus Binataceae bacterium]
MRRWSVAIVFITMAGLCGSRAFAAEARPWLCRDKPVFSSNKPMSYQAVNHGGGRWLMTFMRFDPAGGSGHDGFTVYATDSINARAQGMLEAGQWYAVALYRSGGHWICPGNARESDEPATGVVSDLCYGEEPGTCPVKLTVREQSGSHP